MTPGPKTWALKTWAPKTWGLKDVGAVFSAGPADYRAQPKCANIQPSS